MCGLAGIFSFHPNGPKIDRDELYKIRDAQFLRGPDAAGAWFSSDDRLAFGHRRLSIIDLSSQADQPMVSTDGTNAIVFNGEIYNYGILREELITAGESFNTNSDTEVILKGYCRWGLDVLSRLRGMYAFAIWDDQLSRLFLARDPYGIKPLYYSNDGRAIRFASMVKALGEGTLHTRELDPAGVVGFLMLGSVPEPFTMFRAIRALGAGEYLLVGANGASEPVVYASVGKVWQNAAENPVIAEKDELQQRIDNAVSDTVYHHMVADVPVGAFLSAGIDSATLVGKMSALAKDPLKTITLGFTDFRGTHDDETVLAAKIAQSYKTQHETHWVTEEEIEHDLPLIFDAMDQPSIDGMNTWLVSKIAHERGLKVAVSGVGGDELFGGYEHFQQLPKWRMKHRQMQKIPGALQAGYWLTRLGASMRLLSPKLPMLIRHGSEYPGLYFARRGLFMPWEIEHLIGKDMAAAGLEKVQPLDVVKSGVETVPGVDFAAIAALESTCYLKNQLLRDSDWASMAHSLELRTPLVDYHLLQKLAPYMVVENRPLRAKQGLAAVLHPSLSDELLHRRKSGFSIPMDKWLTDLEIMDGWRGFHYLAGVRSHWSRRMACSLLSRYIQ